MTDELRIYAGAVSGAANERKSVEQVLEQYDRELQKPSSERIIVTNLVAETYSETKDERLFNALFNVVTGTQYEESMREQAAYKLGEIFNPEKHASKVQELITALKNRNDYQYVRKSIVSLLGKAYTGTKQEAIISALEEQLKGKGDSFEVRAESAQTLCVIYENTGEKSALDKLLTYIKTDYSKIDSKKEAELFRWLIQFLREGYTRSNNQEFLGALKELLNPNQVKDPWIRQVAITNLYVADGKSDSTKQIFRDCHNNDPDWDVKAHAHNALFGNLRVSHE